MAGTLFTPEDTITQMRDTVARLVGRRPFTGT